MAVTLGIGFFPVAMGIAILRHNLYDIDRLINRTLVYGSLTALLVLGFAGTVVLFQLILASFTSGNDLAVAGSTLIVFVLIRPLRERLQIFVDRRFYRQKYDTERVLQAFGAKVRDDVNLEALSSDVTDIVATSLQPEHMSLWLQPLKDDSRLTHP